MTWQALPHDLYTLTAKQLCHDSTLLRLIVECLAIALLDRPADAASAIQLRSAICWGVPCAASHG